jgi:hypothetical protein
MVLECPACGEHFEQKPDFLLDGNHSELNCPNSDCKQFLQWDWQGLIFPSRRGWSHGDPKGCHHPDEQRPGARVPRPVHSPSVH